MIDVHSSQRLRWNGSMTLPKRAENILLTDDAVLNVDDFVKPHNCHYWADHDPKYESQYNRGS